MAKNIMADIIAHFQPYIIANKGKNENCTSILETLEKY